MTSNRTRMIAVVVALLVSGLVAVVTTQSDVGPTRFQLISEDVWGGWHLVRLRHKATEACFVAVWTPDGGVALTAADRAVCADPR